MVTRYILYNDGQHSENVVALTVAEEEVTKTRARRRAVFLCVARGAGLSSPYMGRRVREKDRGAHRGLNTSLSEGRVVANGRTPKDSPGLGPESDLVLRLRTVAASVDNLLSFLLSFRGTLFAVMTNSFVLSTLSLNASTGV